MRATALGALFSVCFLGCGDMTTSVSHEPRKDMDVKEEIDHITFVGNSYHDEGIDFSSLSSDLGCSIAHHWTGGVMSAWKYAKLRSLAKHDRFPDVVFISTDMNTIMFPAIRTTGKYWDAIVEAAEGDSAILGSIESRIEYDCLIADRWDLATYVSKTFLPGIIEACEQMGSILVIARMRTRIETQDPLRETPKQREFRNALAAFLSNRNVIYLDYSQDPEIEASDFYDDYHLNAWGRSKWTKMIREDLHSQMLGITSFHHVIGKPMVSPCGIRLPGNNGMLPVGKEITLSRCSNGWTKWSISYPQLKTSEVFLGSGSQVITKIPPPFKEGYSTANICAYSGGCTKICVPCSVSCEESDNRPPEVLAGADTITNLGQSLRLHGTVVDESILTDSLKIFWEIVRGKARIDNPESLQPLIMPEKNGLLVLALTAYDGEYKSCDLVSVSVNEVHGFTIQSPGGGTSYASGDTLHVRWNASGVGDCVLTVTFDGGISFHDLSDATISVGDSRWGDFAWIIPDWVPETECARIRLRAYDGTATSISVCFAIY